MAENSPGKQRRNGRGRPFVKGQSGNPAGKPKGTRHATTLAAEALLGGEAEALTRKAIELGLAGDTVALRLCLERIMPARKSRYVSFNLPAVDAASDLAPAFSAVLAAMASGELAPDEAVTVAGVLEMKRKAAAPEVKPVMVFRDAYRGETTAEAIAKRYPEGVPAGAPVYILEWEVSE
jgi:Family of unknown function (DUF5681)